MKQTTIYALGFFDGVHLGHTALLTACRDLAAETGSKTGVVTFDGHPDTLVRGITPALLNTPADRALLLKSHGMETVITLPFDRALMDMPWQDFIQLLITEYHAAGFVCGSDFRFGRKGEGSVDQLAQLGLPCRIVPQQYLDGIRISSTHIRSLLEEGRMEEAVRFLGHPHILTGTVEHGRHLGRTIGIPTANLHIPDGVLTPRHGVYACKATLETGEEYLAVTNIGSRPTVNGHRITVEPWLLDFSGDLYGQRLTLSLYAFLRPEQKFSDLAELSAQIRKNEAQTRKFFGK